MIRLAFLFSFLSLASFTQEWETVALLPGNSPINQIHYVSNTEIYVSSQYYKMHRWDGSEWIALGTFNPNYMNHFQYVSENEVYATYNNHNNGNSTDGYNYIAHWNGSTWTNIAELDVEGIFYNFKLISQNEIYAVGDFDDIDGYRWRSVAKYDGNDWSVIGGNDSEYGTYSGNNSLWVNNENDIYSKRDGYSDGGEKKVKHWNGTNWTILRNYPLDEIDGVDRIHVASANEIYTNTRNADNNLASIGYWDGTYWRILGDIQADMNTNNFHGSLDFVYVNANEIYAVGSALKDSDDYKYQVARWNGTNWNFLGDIGANNPIRVAFYKDGFLYVGGSFTESGKTVIKRFDTSTVLNTDNFTINIIPKVFPNPVTSICHLGKKYSKVTIYDTLGKVISTFSNTSEIHLSSFNNGVYILKLVDGNGKIVVQKVLKE